MKKYFKLLSKSFLVLIFLSLNQSIVFAHHIGVEIMGKEYEPHGVFQHTLCIVITALFFTFAIYGFVSFIKKFLPEGSRQIKVVSNTEGPAIGKSK